MKVTTDACLFGALLPDAQPTNNMLDIGTGTGLLSLMYAQRFPNARIIALEIASEAAQQAQENVTSSPFAHQITVDHQDFLSYKPKQKFSFVFCNPPFHQRQLISPLQAKNIALHDAGLTLHPLFEKVPFLLQPNGLFSLLIPFYRKNEAIELGEKNGFTLIVSTVISHSPAHSPSRFVGTWQLGKQVIPPTATSLFIKNEQQAYTPDFKQLLTPFYLHF